MGRAAALGMSILETNDPRTYSIIGAAMEVHMRRGPGFHETVYRDCCAIEFAERGIPYVTEALFPCSTGAIVWATTTERISSATTKSS